LLALAGGAPPSLAQTLLAPGRQARVPAVRRVPLDHPTIQAAIQAARDGDVVLVSPGTHAEHLDFLGKAIEVVGFEGAARTILAPTTDGAVVRFHRGEGRDSRLIGFTLRNGTSDPESTAGGVSGVDPNTGVASRPTISDCVIERNFASQDYGGFGPAGLSGDALLERCILRQNHSHTPTTAGGAQGRLTLVQCVVEENEGCSAGGLILEAGARVVDCVIRANRAGSCYTREGPLSAFGGGIQVRGPGVVVEGSLLVDNVVVEGPEAGGFGECIGESRGGALFVDALLGEARLARCTIVGNRWETCAEIGGIAGSPALVDCILYSNQDPSAHYADASGFRYSDVQGGAAGPGSFDLFPELVDPGAGDFRLGPSSPCIDRGDPLSAPDPDGTRADVGAFHRPLGPGPVGVAWREEAPLVAADAAQSPYFGTSVAAAGDTLLVGSTGGGLAPGPNSVSVLRRQGSGWAETQRLESGVPYDAFGWSVALEGDLAAIGAVGYVGVEEGSIHVYERAAPDAAFEPSARLAPGPGVLGFGAAVALDGDTLVVGAHDGNGFGQGLVFVYQRLRRGHWRPVARLSAPDVDSWLYSSFGAVVDVDGTTLAVGAPLFGDDLTYFGAVLVYERAGSSPYSWVHVRTLLPRPPEPYGSFGLSLALEADTLIVGHRSGATTFERDGPGLPWREAQRLEPRGGPPGTGSNVLLRGDRAWITKSSPSLVQPAVVWEFARANAGAPWSESARVALPAGALFARRHHALTCAEGSLFLGTAFTAAREPAVRWLTRGPEVHALQLDQAADEEPVAIRGERLDEVNAVLLDGVAQPIVSQSDTELVILPARRAPGFSDLTLASAEDAWTLGGSFASLPTLRAVSSGVGGTLDVQLENGATGAFALLYALGLRPAPLVIRQPPTWFGLELALDPARYPVLALEPFPSAGGAALRFDLPDDPDLVGLPFYLQAWCQRGLLGPLRYSFSNTAASNF
jgi:hypothetical protein